MSPRSSQHTCALRMIKLVLAAISFGAVCATERPVIGILTQELDRELRNHYGSNVFKSYIAASYVKYFESSGARVVPIPTDQSLEYYRNLLREVNGVVFPGGHSNLEDSSGYGPSGRKLLTALEDSAKEGRPIPALGICLGMELMAWHDYKKALDEFGEGRRSYEDGPVVPCRTLDINLPLKYKTNPKLSNIFKRGSDQQIDYLKSRPVTANYHKFCITENSLRRTNIRRQWNVVATSQNKYGMEFVSVMQSEYRHFYAIMFHPEKNAFEWSHRKTFVHDIEAINAMRVFGDSFVDLCRQNENVLPQNLERERLIFKHVPVFSGKRGLQFEQIYLFKSHDF